MKTLNVAKYMMIAIFTLVTVGVAEASRFPASDVTKSLKKKLSLKKKDEKTYVKRSKKKLGLDVDPTAQRDLTFESHDSVDSESEGVTRRVVDKDFESLVN